MAPSKPLDARRNRLLAGLPDEALNEALRRLEPVRLAPRAVLLETESPASTVYFPLSGAVAVMPILEQGRVHAGLTGRDGVVGLFALLGLTRAESRYVVQVEGAALAGEADALQELAVRLPALRDRAVRCVQAWTAELVATAACERAHTLRQRCCRLLLRLIDQSGEQAFSITHDDLADMLGVRRATATVLAGALRREGCVAYRHGRFTVVDPATLAQQACGCHARIREASGRILGDQPV